MPKHRASRSTSSRSLAKIQRDPALPALVQSLTPGALAQLCIRIGVSDATEIMALASAQQLVQALDATLWRSPRPGRPEVFDRSELMAWLAAWLEVGEDFTGGALARVPDEDLVLYLSSVLRVSSHEMWGFERSTEIEDLDRIYAPSYHESAYGPYVVTAIVDEDWEVVRATLDVLWQREPARVLHLLSQLSADESMLAPQKNRESSNDDFLSSRESARERGGHVTASGARAFLAFGDAQSLDDLAALREHDLETRRHLSAIGNLSGQSVPGTAEQEEPVERLLASEDPAMDAEALQQEARTGRAAVQAIRAELQAHGLLDAPPSQRLLTHSGPGKSLPLIESLVQLSSSDPAALDARARELAYLANVLLVGVALNGTAMSAADARQAALSLCNLGFELLKKRQEELSGREPGLVRLFLVGRAALRDVPDRLVRAFSCALDRLKAVNPVPGHDWLVAEAQAAFDDLRRAVARRDLAAAREAMTLMGFFFDSRSCRRAVALLEEIPRLASAADGTAALAWIESRRDLAALSRLLEGIQIKGHGPV
jgi:hypothetical protein